MKRTICLIFALVLALSVVCGAAAAENTFKTAYYTLTLPQGWEIDTEDVGVEEEDKNLKEEYLGSFYEKKGIGLFIEAYLVYYKDSELQNTRLWEAGEAELQSYEQEIMEVYEDDDPVLLDRVQADRIPFVLIKAADDEGEYLYAETMSNGYAIAFYAYIIDDDETLYSLNNQSIEQFKNILKTFQPMT
ncbi:MAG: hypothetical protein IJP78_13790 [Clostridia bacterium]|nr:hypothetical protein [Clostridia bacterium]